MSKRSWLVPSFLVLTLAFAGFALVRAESAASRLATPVACAPQPAVERVSLTAPPPDAPLHTDRTPLAMPAPEPTRPAPHAPRLRDLPTLRLARMAVARGIDHREPVAAGEPIEVGERAYAFLELRNDAPTPARLVVTFAPPGGGERVGHVVLTVPTAARYRTWAFTEHASRPGLWTAHVETEDGVEVGRAQFEVGAALLRRGMSGGAPRRAAAHGGSGVRGRRGACRRTCPAAKEPHPFEVESD